MAIGSIWDKGVTYAIASGGKNNGRAVTFIAATIVFHRAIPSQSIRIFQSPFRIFLLFILSLYKLFVKYLKIELNYRIR